MNNTIKIVLDKDPTSPREWDNLGTMICFHSGYNLGDKHSYESPYEFTAEVNSKNALMLPVYLYDHSGLTINTSGFSCPWDSMQVGWIYVTKEKVREEYGKKRISRKLSVDVLHRLTCEVSTYDQYIRGEVYGYIIEDSDGELVDSCFGFFGDNPYENGMSDRIPEEYMQDVKNQFMGGV